MRMTVADLMCESPVTVGPECTSAQALEAFFEYETPELYVVDHAGRLLGVLPDYELLKVHLSGEARGARAEDLMSRSVTIVSPEADAATVAGLFRVGQCSRIPVVKAGKLVGMITRHDVLRVMAVFRRMDHAAESFPTGPKRPRNFAKGAKAGTTRSARAKTTATKTPGIRTCSKPASRRAGR